jgi:hypothetical protein
MPRRKIEPEIEPLVTLTEIAAIYRISVSTIRRGLQNGTFSPRPWKTYPYRWRRPDIAADLQRPYVEQPRRPHGFAATRARRQTKPTTGDRNG